MCMYMYLYLYVKVLIICLGGTFHDINQNIFLSHPQNMPMGHGKTEHPQGKTDTAPQRKTEKPKSQTEDLAKRDRFESRQNKPDPGHLGPGPEKSKSNIRTIVDLASRDEFGQNKLDPGRLGPGPVKSNIQTKVDLASRDRFRNQIKPDPDRLGPGPEKSNQLLTKRSPRGRIGSQYYSENTTSFSDDHKNMVNVHLHFPKRQTESSPGKKD